ncbi:hypothetical protein [Micromonospora sp. NPDC023814]
MTSLGRVGRAAFTWYAVAIIRKENRAVELRRRRGVPAPARYPY